MSLVGSFELEVIGKEETFAVFAEIRLPIFPDMEAAKEVILRMAKEELNKLAENRGVFAAGHLAVLDPASRTWKTPIENPDDPRVLIWGVFKK